MVLRIDKVIAIVLPEMTAQPQTTGSSHTDLLGTGNSVGSDETVDDAKSSLWFVPDNASHACHGWWPSAANSNNCCCCSQDHHHPWTSTPFSSVSSSPHFILLRWTKLIAVKLARSYFALPALLLVLTLCLGLVVGYLLGRRHEQQRRNTDSATKTRAEKHQHQRNHSNYELPPANPSSASGSYSGYNCWVIWCWWGWRLLWLGWVHRWLQIKNALVWAPSLHTTTTIINTNDELSMDKSKDVQQRQQHQQHEKTDQQDRQPLVENNVACVGGNSCSTTTTTTTIRAKEALARLQLKSLEETQQESNLSDPELPRHIAVIMDGNRRYGMEHYDNSMQGHWDGSRKLLQFAKWCIAERIQELTVYAFSTENWHRTATEVSTLLQLIAQHCEELRVEAIQRGIMVRIHSTDNIQAIPLHIRQALERLEHDTNNVVPMSASGEPTVASAESIHLRMNICLSYGSRGEIVRACQMIANSYRSGNVTHITEETVTQHMLIDSSPDLLIRTSGEVRLSNFLLWQMAYTELFFVKKHWPEIEKKDFLEVLQRYARGRQRRYGK